ncbi:hypothetical protein ACUU9X_28195 [Bacillus cereus]|uniref:hypothetical protein n=1 Tax=Bacillus cereus TaxID=1396 RepID=UPI000BFD6185|nr:hypothetical protein COE50_26100 [Bacillus anthracis]
MFKKSNDNFNANTTLTIVTAVAGIIASFFANKLDYSIPISIAILIFVVFVSIFLSMLDARQQKIKQLDDQLKKETKELWNHYGELSRFERDKSIRNFLKQFTLNQEYVCGVQIYKYSLKKTSKVKTEINIKYLDGYISQHEELNAIIQGNYSYDKSQLRSFKKVIESNNDNKLIEFISKTRDYLNFRDETLLNDDDALRYSLLQLARFYLRVRHNIVIKDEEVLSHKKAQKLSKKKRIGIAHAIIKHEILNDSMFYQFDYNGDDDRKSSRKYLTYIVESVRGEKFLCLIVTKPEQFWNEYLLNHNMNSIRADFQDSLSQSGLVYDKLSNRRDLT